MRYQGSILVFPKFHFIYRLKNFITPDFFLVFFFFPLTFLTSNNNDLVFYDIRMKPLTKTIRRCSVATVHGSNVDPNLFLFGLYTTNWGHIHFFFVTLSINLKSHKYFSSDGSSRRNSLLQLKPALEGSVIRKQTVFPNFH